MENNGAEKIRVTIIAPSMRVVGGQSIQARRLIDAFEKNENIEVNFLPNDPEAPFQNVKLLRTIFTSLKFWWLLVTNLSKTDIVHIFSSGTTSYIISTLPPLVVAKLFGKKTILNYHTGEAEQHLKDWRLTAKPTMKRFDKIIVPSQFLVDIFAKFELSSEAIFNFVDSEKYKFRQRSELRPVFLSNRNFEAHYNVSCTIRAFAEISKLYAEAQLTIAGFGSEEGSLKKLVEDLRLKNVSFVGKIPNDAMPKLYDSADIYLNSSVVDNMPLSIIEAFSSGTAVVSSNAGGIPYMIKNGETGLLADVNDFAELAKKAIFLLENIETAKKIIANAREEVVKYSWENVSARWLKTYQTLKN